VAEYSKAMQIAEGGGLEEEEENIEVLEMPVSEAIAMVENGLIMDAKTIMLLQYVKLHNIV
jgi:GDP-mannose pyrophosphatase NudK